MNSLIQDILSETQYVKNPYFISLKDGSFSKEDFIETQVQFFFAVIFFSRPMAALAAKIPTPQLRMEIIRNVWEEHGEGNPHHIHGNTFRIFLDRLGSIKDADIEARALWPEVRIFNTTLAGACVLDEYLIGVGMMGIIERMFCEISQWLGQGIVQRGWLREDNMIHYNLHEDLDIKHSQDFFDVLLPAWEKSDENKYYIEQGLRLGARVFDGLYRGLYEARHRRALRTVRGPHSRAEG